MFLRRSPLVLDDAGLASADREELRRLVEAARAVGVADAGPGAARDAMSYVITVEGDGADVVLRGNDAEGSPEFEALLGFLQGRGR